MGTLVEDAHKAAQWMSTALNSSGYRADFSLKSLKEIDRFFDEHSSNGQAIAGGLLSQDLGSRLFSLGAYVGEVIRRTYGGTWRGDDGNPRGEIEIEMVLPGGGVIWPVQRVMKRFANGTEDGVHVYGLFVGEQLHPVSDCKLPGADSPAKESTNRLDRPWWRFWR